MNKSALLKIAGIVVGSFVVITIAIFFLYPYLNEEKYEQIQAERLEGQSMGDFESDSSDVSLSNSDKGGEAMGMSGFSDPDSSGGDLEADIDPLQMTIDSLVTTNDSLVQQLDSTQASLFNLENLLANSGLDPLHIENAKKGEGDVELIAAADEPREEFSERVKSLLNLDEEQLTPIANQMSQQELVRIYNSSGNIQREKLLRSLSAERAAKLMKEIML